MDIGMLWFDDSTRPFEEKLQRAVGYYVEKYGRTPTLCLVNPDTLEARLVHMGGIELRQARTVMPIVIARHSSRKSCESFARRMPRRTACCASGRSADTPPERHTRSAPSISSGGWPPRTNSNGRSASSVRVSARAAADFKSLTTTFAPLSAR